MIKRLIPILMLVALTLHCAVGDAFDQRWPSINRFMQGGISNLTVGGLVTNMPSGGYVQYVGSNTWRIWFPVGGIVTQVVTYVPPVQYLNVSGGLLTMSGDPTGGVNVVELIPATLASSGFTLSDGTPATSWIIGKGINPIRIRRDANGLSIRDYADSEYRDLVCRNLSVVGTNNISNLNVVNIDTNRLILNSNVINTTPTMDAFYSVRRGISPTASVQWVESLGQWFMGYDGAMYSVGHYATQEVALVWPGVTNIGKTATDSVSNLWPWVVAITPTQIHNWDTVHVWSTNETIDTVTNKWLWLDGWYTTWTNWIGTNNINPRLTVLEGQTNSYTTTNDSRELSLSNTNNSIKVRNPVDDHDVANAKWVRGLFDVSSEFFTTTNRAYVGWETNHVYQFQNSVAPAVQSSRAYTGLTNGMYVGYGITTQKFSEFKGPFVVNEYLSMLGGSVSRSLTVRPEIYYTYSTNATTITLGDWEGTEQTIKTGTNLYSWVISFPKPTLTGDVYIVRCFRVIDVQGTPNKPDFGVTLGSNTASHIGIDVLGTSSGIPEAPLNTMVYARSNGTWVAIPTSGGASPSSGITNVLYAFRANMLGANQAISDSVFTKILFTNPVFNTGNAYLATNSAFVVPTNGYYAFNCKVKVDGGASYCQVALYTNLVVHESCYQQIWANNGLSQVFFPVKLILGTSVSIYINPLDGRNVIGTVTESVFGGYYVGP